MENKDVVSAFTKLHDKYPLRFPSLRSADIYLNMLLTRALKEF